MASGCTRRGAGCLLFSQHGNMRILGFVSPSAFWAFSRRRSMRTKAECLRLIEMVREAGHDPESAYLVRTRFRRALLGSARFATVVAGANGPDFPGSYAIPEGASPGTAKVLSLCSHINERTLR